MAGAKIAVRDSEASPVAGSINCKLDQDIRFSTRALESYAFSRWEPLVYDAMVVAASLEIADKICRRSTRNWPRQLAVRIPVTDPARWQSPLVLESLLDAIGFVTGDRWSLEFFKSAAPQVAPKNGSLDMFRPPKAVLAYSEGLDSFVVARLAKASLGNDVVRVRVGGKRDVDASGGIPFVSVPYRVTPPTNQREPSVRSRGFKFAMIAGLAAFLTGATKVIVPESGQGSLGPPLVSVGQAYPDYRNHPVFTRRMERFLHALLEHPIHFEFPRLWSTKAETLADFVALGLDEEWQSTKSCWRDSRWTSIGGSWRHCGVCAACMLRRVSVNAAGLSEPSDTYVCTDMRASSLEAAVDRDFNKLNSAYRDYAIAGVRHMDDLAGLAKKVSNRLIGRHARAIGHAIGSAECPEELLSGLFYRHADEWGAYLESLGPGSFLRKWVRHVH